MYHTTSIRGTIREGIRFGSMTEEELYRAIKTDLPIAMKNRGIPCDVREDNMKSGGMFGSKKPLLVVSYPNPPSSFFDMGFLVNGNSVSFVYLGESAQNTKQNKKAALEAEGKVIRAAMVNPDEFVLQQEKLWNASVLDAFDSLCQG